MNDTVKSVPKPVTAPRLLLGEGKEEVLFFQALIEHLGLDGFAVEDYGGKTCLKAYLGALVKRSGFDVIDTLLVIRDADENASGAFSSVANALQACGLPVPLKHAAFARGKPRTAIFVLPDGLKAGMLEDLCIESVGDDPAIKCVNDFLECVARKCGHNPQPQSKAKVHAWLASRPRPDRRLGEAAAAGSWPWNSVAFEPLVDFLKLGCDTADSGTDE
jgi:hypothetical protein